MNVSDINSAGIQQIAAARGVTTADEVWRRGEGDSRLIGYTLSDGFRLIRTNADPVGEEDDGFLQMWHGTTLSDALIIEAVERGSEWGRQEAALQLEAVENGHQLTAGQWTTGMWCGYYPYRKEVDEADSVAEQRHYSDMNFEYDSILNRAAQAAYEAAVEVAVIPEQMYVVRYQVNSNDLGPDAIRTIGDRYPGGHDETRYESIEDAKAAIFAKFGQHGEWIDEDGRTHYHTGPEVGCGSAWVEEVGQ